ncbi:MAG: PEGA domain-containing protein [Candidatus Acidiferrales bacterium]
MPSRKVVKVRKFLRSFLPAVIACLFVESLAALPARAQAQVQAPPQGQNQVMGEVRFEPTSKVEKTSGVWVDGEYVGYIDELKGDKKVLLLPGTHTISFRQSGYKEFEQEITIEPGQVQTLHVAMQRDPRVQYSTVTSEVKLKVTPDRAAVFLDDAFVGHVHEFGGAGRAMLVSPGKHRVKIELVGYQTFETEINLLPKQKFEIKTDLVKGSINDAGPLIKKPQS